MTALALAILELLTVPSSRQATPYQWAYCRRAPGGCRARTEALVAAFTATGRAYNLDPYLLAATAYQESRLNPAAIGPGGECGVAQLHPARRDARAIAFCRSEKVRKHCLRTEPGACQEQVIATMGAILRRSIDYCDGDVMGGLWRYHTGQRRCIESRYGRRVMATMRALRGEP